jgi:hypothetical protein
MGSKRGGRGKGGEMTQTMYAGMNKIKIKNICFREDEAGGS